MTVRRTAIALFAGCSLVCGAANAEEIEDFYSDATLTVYVGLSAGGGYDSYARLLASCIGGEIPGTPTVIVQNMPGAGGLRMMNYVANAAPPDGLHIGAPQRSLPFEPLLEDDSKADFDPLALNWIGSINSETSVAVSTAESGIETWQDLKENKLIVAASGAGTGGAVLPIIMRNLLGFQYEVILGYPGGNEMTLAMENGEVGGRATYSWTSLKPRYDELIGSGKWNMLYQMGLRKHPDLPDLPLILDLTETEEQRKMIVLQITPFELGRPFFVAADVPDERVAVLRQAFNACMSNEEMVANAQKQQLEINATSGDDMQTMVNDVYDTPKALVESLKEARH